MGRPAGRPHQVPREKVLAVLKKNKHLITRPDSSLKSKQEEIWKSISRELESKISCRTLYSMACQKDIRLQIFDADRNISINSSISSQDRSENSMHNASNRSMNEDLTFIVTATKSEYLELVEQRQCPRREENRKKVYIRTYDVLKPGLWQHWISDKIWNAIRIKCAFNFKKHTLSNSAKSGTIQGKCNCESTLHCEIDASDDIVRIKCVIERSVGICGKRPLRAPIRHDLGKQLRSKSVAVYRTNWANEKMELGDPEPPHLYKASALYNAKYEYNRTQHLHEDPLQALGIMQLNSLANIVHNLGQNPVKINYWTNHQMHMWQSYAKSSPPCIYLDATGSILKPVLRYDKTPSKQLFLYLGVINFNGQFSVTQCISERQDTIAIMSWLAEWEKAVVITPKEVVCDSSRALLTASIKAFTAYNTIEKYADGCDHEPPPACYIRIDVAHFVHMYAALLKTAPPRVRIFYLAVLGQLILSRSKDDAAKILEALFVVIYSETEGVSQSGEPTECETRKNELRALVDPNYSINTNATLTTEEAQPEIEKMVESYNNGNKNRWYNWAKNIEEKAKDIASSVEGDRENAHYLPHLGIRLVNDMRAFPLWSCVCRDSFGYGRVPASSASVESEFNYVKTRMLEDCTTPMRVDSFVERHVQNLTGRMKQADAQNKAADRLNHRKPHTESESSGDSKIDDDNLEEDEESAERPIIPSDDSISGPARSVARTPLPTSPVSVSEDNRAEGLTPTKKKFENVVESIDLTNVSPEIREQLRNDGQTCTFCAQQITSPPGEQAFENLCADCNSIESADKILAAREIENWGGLAAVEQKSSSRYLTRNHATFDAMSQEPLSRIPNIRNANSMKLQATRFGAVRYTLSNTCAFDSVFQVLLVAACDRPVVKEKFIALAGTAPTVHMVSYVIQKGLKPHAYRLRSKILKDIFPIVENRSTSINAFVDCAVNVSYLTSQLMRDMPSLEETSTCARGCAPRKKCIRVPRIPNDAMRSNTFVNVIDDYVSLKKPTPCGVKGCSGSETTNFTKSGLFMFLEIENSEPFELLKIPLNIRDPVDTENRFELIGFIDFKAPPGTRRRLSDALVENNQIGHYTAICLRPPKTWIEFNDLKDKGKIIKGSPIVYPELLIYAKKNLNIFK